MGGVHTRDGFRAERYGYQHARLFRVFKNDRIRDPDDLEALFAEPMITIDVARNSSGKLMNLAVGLYDQASFKADEINDERTDRMLPAEAKAPLLATPKDGPQRLLSRCGS